MLSTIDSMSPSMTAPSSGIKIHTKKWYQQMALILLCEEVIEPTASAVMCVKNDRICDIIFQFEICTFCSKWKVTFRKVTPTTLKVNVKKIRQVLLDPWHVWAPIWVHSAPWGSIFPVKNSFSHIFPAPGGSPHQSLFLRYEIEKGLRAVPQRHQGLVKKLEWIETLFKYRFARSFVI